MAFIWPKRLILLLGDTDHTLPVLRLISLTPLASRICLKAPPDAKMCPRSRDPGSWILAMLTDRAVRALLELSNFFSAVFCNLVWTRAPTDGSDAGFSVRPARAPAEQSGDPHSLHCSTVPVKTCFATTLDLSCSHHATATCFIMGIDAATKKHNFPFSVPRVLLCYFRRHLCQPLLSIWGCPVCLLSGDGPLSSSEVFRAIYKLLGTHQAYTNSYHPQIDCGVERLNHTLAQLLSIVISEGQDNRDRTLPDIQLSCNKYVLTFTAIALDDLHLDCMPRLHLTFTDVTMLVGARTCSKVARLHKRTSTVS